MLTILFFFIFAFSNKGGKKIKRKTKTRAILTYVAPSVGHFLKKNLTELTKNDVPVCLWKQRAPVGSCSFCEFLWPLDEQNVAHEYVGKHQPGRCYTYWPSLTETDNQFGCHSLSFWGFLAANECQGDVFDPVGPARN